MNGSSRFFWLQDPVEPQKRKRCRNQRDDRRGRGKQGADLHVFFLQYELGVQGLVNLSQIRCGARVKILAAGQVGDRLERLLIETHAHRPTLKADGLTACGADSNSEDANTAYGGHAGSVDGVGARGSLTIGE